MLFTEIIFLPFLFITFTLFFCFRNNEKAQLILFLASSYVFYGWWNVKFLGLIIFSSLLDFYIGKLIFRTESILRRRVYLAITLVGNLGLLGYFKYANFFIDNLNHALSAAGVNVSVSTLNIILPVGISFYTFQSLSYSLDIYFRKLKPSGSLLKFMVFVSAFPQLVAGPIVRAKEFLPQLDSNLFNKSKDEGVFYIIYGLIKKLLIADILGHYFVDKVFADPTSFTSMELLLGTYFYAFQIFFDFSAYSDIAIGLGKIFGIELPINFKYPYSARNPREFWQKWHITLSTWLRDYLYIPLGGNRGSKIFICRNILVVMFLGGLWHGANWTFILWGMLHALYIIIYRFLGYIKIKVAEGIHDFVKIFFFFNLVCLTWVFFRAENVTSALVYLKSLFSFKGGPTVFTFQFTVIMLCISFFVHYIVEPKLGKVAQLFNDRHWFFKAAFIYLFLVLMSYLGEKNIAHQAFIYFQF